MSYLVKNLLKTGIKGLAGLEEDYFKENVCHALAFKLNESLKELHHDCAQHLFYKSTTTKETEELKMFLEFVQKFEHGNFEFKNNSLLNIKDSDMQAIKELFESLSPANRQKMVEEIFESSNNFIQHVEFYNKSKGLLK